VEESWKRVAKTCCRIEKNFSNRPRQTAAKDASGRAYFLRARRRFRLTIHMAAGDPRMMLVAAMGLGDILHWDRVSIEDSKFLTIQNGLIDPVVDAQRQRKFSRRTDRLPARCAGRGSPTTEHAPFG